jgi:hypothetical protein
VFRSSNRKRVSPASTEHPQTILYNYFNYVRVLPSWKRGVPHNIHAGIRDVLELCSRRESLVSKLTFSSVCNNFKGYSSSTGASRVLGIIIKLLWADPGGCVVLFPSNCSTYRFLSID